MERAELAVWFTPGEAPLRGVVVGRRSSTKLVVRWEDDREEVVGIKDPVVRFAQEGSLLLKWLLDRGALEERFRDNPTGVFIDFIRDHGGPVAAAKVQKALVDAGIEPGLVKSAWNKAKLEFKAHPHVAILGTTYSWSPEPIDPHAALRRLTPEQALERLLKPGLKADEKKIVADVVRSGFK